MDTKRNIIVDVLRGIAVVAVLLGHAIQRGFIVNYENKIIFKIIYSFHMPLFMLLSGYALHRYTKKWDSSFLKKRFLRLIIPTIVWSYIIYFMRSFNFVGIKEFVVFQDTVLDYTKALALHPDFIIWFLYIVFLCDVIFFIQNKIMKNKNEKLSILITIAVAILLFIIPNNNFGIPRLKIYFPIFSLGYYVSKYSDAIIKYLKFMIVPSVVIYLALFSRYNVAIDNVYIYYLISISAIIIIYNLVTWIKVESIYKFFAFFGKYSLEIYLCQCVCLNIGFGLGLLRAITIFITATTISVILAKLTNKSNITKLLLYGKKDRKYE